MARIRASRASSSRPQRAAATSETAMRDREKLIAYLGTKSREELAAILFESGRRHAWAGRCPSRERAARATR